MIRLTGIYAHNFQCVKNIKYDFTEDDTLTLIEGEVVGQSKQDSNGAGKSTLVDIITWVLYGKTLRGTKKDSVISDFADRDCVCELRGFKDGKEFFVRRARKHSTYGNTVSLTVAGKDIAARNTSEASILVEKFIGVDYPTFMSTLVLTDKSPRFSTLSPNERTKVFEDVLNLDRFTRSYEVTKERLSKRNSIINSLEGKFSEETREVEKLELELERVVQNGQQEDERKEESIATLEAQLRELMESLPTEDNKKDLDTKSKALQDKIVELRNDWAAEKQDLQQELNLLQNVHTTLLRYFSLEEDLTRLRKEMQEVRVKLQEFTTTGKCPTCTQDVSSHLEEDLKSKIRNSLESKSIEIGSIARAQRSLILEAGLDVDKSYTQKDLEFHSDRITNLKNEFSIKEEKLNNSINSLEEALRGVHKTLEVSGDCEILRVKVESLKSAENSYSKLQDSLESTISLKRSKLQEYPNRIRIHKKIRDRLQLLQDAFSPKGVKSYIIESLIPFMNEKAVYYSDIFTDSVVQIKFVGSKELKSGDTVTEIGVEASYENGGDEYSKFSEGERRRCDLIIQFVLSEVRALKSNVNFNVVFYDELFDKIDASGIETILRGILQVNSGKSTYIITHNNELSDKVQNRIMMRKKGRVSELLEL